MADLLRKAQELGLLLREQYPYLFPLASEDEQTVLASVAFGRTRGFANVASSAAGLLSIIRVARSVYWPRFAGRGTRRAWQFKTASCYVQMNECMANARKVS